MESLIFFKEKNLGIYGIRKFEQIPQLTNYSFVDHSTVKEMLVPWKESYDKPMTKTEVALVIKNLPANAGDLKDMGSIPGSGRSLGGGHSNPLQYSCLENPMDRGA